MRKKILLPTDFSKNSWNSIQYALKLFENRSCDFYILNTYTRDSSGIDSTALLDPEDVFNMFFEKRSKEGLGDILKRLMIEHTNSLHQFHVLSRSTPFLYAVKNVVEELKIDMVVMGAKGMTNRREDAYGTNTLDVIQTIRKCPVLVIPKEVTFELPKEIVLATNFNSACNISDVEYLAEIARLSNASVQILSPTASSDLSLKQKDNKNRLIAHLKGIEHSFRVLNEVKIAAELSCFVEVGQSKMISYVDKKPSLWERLGFGKPALDKLGYFEAVPVLALRG